jgi:hypothetical protein
MPRPTSFIVLSRGSPDRSETHEEMISPVCVFVCNIYPLSFVSRWTVRAEPKYADMTSYHARTTGNANRAVRNLANVTKYCPATPPNSRFKGYTGAEIFSFISRSRVSPFHLAMEASDANMDPAPPHYFTYDLLGVCRRASNCLHIPSLLLNLSIFCFLNVSH